MIFKNFCPFKVGDIYLTTNSTNPSSIYLGTTWEKIENKFLLGSSSNYSLGTFGGASTVTLSVDNLPSHTHSATTASHSHTQPTHKHNIKGRNGWSGGLGYITMQDVKTNEGIIPSEIGGGETTGSSSPVTTIGATGKGTSFSIMPPYIVVNIWKRLS